MSPVMTIPRLKQFDGWELYNFNSNGNPYYKGNPYYNGSLKADSGKFRSVPYSPLHRRGTTLNHFILQH